MPNKLKEFTTSYKYFYNNDIVLVTSAKVGSRFLKAVSENLEIQYYNNPFNEQLLEIEFDRFRWKQRSDFVAHAYEELFKNRQVTFFIRNPYSRFVSGLTTMLSIIMFRAIQLKHDPFEYMKSYFDVNDSEKVISDGIADIIDLVEKFLIDNNESHLKTIIEKYVLTNAIYNDSHVEHHHYFAYQYMNQLKELGASITYMDINLFDDYLKTKEISEWGYVEKMEKFKKTEKKTVFYQVIKDNLDIWKSQINELSLYLNSEQEFYHKIKNEYEILL